MSKYQVEIVNGEIQLPEEVVDLFAKVREIDRAMKLLKEEKDSIEKPLKNAMMKHGIQKFSCEYMTASTIADSWTEAVDTEQMKKDGIYEKYMFKMPRNGYVRINYKKEKKDD